MGSYYILCEVELNGYAVMVNVKITREGATKEDKAKLIKGVAQLLQDVLGKNPNTTILLLYSRQSGINNCQHSYVTRAQS